MISGPQPQGKADIVVAIRQAASATGAGFDFLLKTAQRESGLNPQIRAKSSSATGLFQFTEATWNAMVARYGGRHGVDIAGMSKQQVLALRDDPALSARMAGELAQENAAVMGAKLGREPTPGELYAAHFLGAGEAARLAIAARKQPDVSAAQLFPTAAAANPRVFTDGAGQPLSVSALYASLTKDEQSVPEAATRTISSPSESPSASITQATAAEAILSAASQPSSASRLAAIEDRTTVRVSIDAPEAQMAGAKLTTSLLAALLDVQAGRNRRI